MPVHSRPPGYTPGMKTAISVPDDVFERAERFARRSKRTRSDVYSAAVREYVARHAPDEITEAVDRVVGAEPDLPDEFVEAASTAAVSAIEW